MSKKPTKPGIQAYGVVRGRPTQAKVAQPAGDQPHYHVMVKTSDNHSFDVAINVESTDGTEVLFRLINAFTPPHPTGWLALPSGATTIGEAGATGLGVDFIRQHLTTRAQMALLPIGKGHVNALNDALTDLATRAIADPSAEVFAFGQLYAAASGGKPNPVFGFSPDLGVHDIHLNQGNPTGANGTYQDGAFLVHFASDGHWEAALLAFQSQSFTTNNSTGDPS